MFWMKDDVVSLFKQLVDKIEANKKPSEAMSVLNSLLSGLKQKRTAVIEAKKYTASEYDRYVEMLNVLKQDILNRNYVTVSTYFSKNFGKILGFLRNIEQ